MDFLNNINKETLVICEENYINHFINRSTISNIKFMSFTDFNKKYFFDYDDATIDYIIDKYNIKRNIALIYLNNLYFVEDKDYNIKKLDYLKDLKKELDNNNLLVYNSNFLDYLSDIDIIFYDIDLEDFYIKAYSKIKYQLIYPEYKEYDHQVYEFSTIEEEIEYVANKISELIYNGIDINNIKLTNIDSSYYKELFRIFSLYNLFISIPYKSTLYSYDYIRNFLSNFETSSLEDSLDNIDNKHPLYNILIDVINKYRDLSKDKLIEKIKDSSIRNTEYNNYVEIIDYNSYPANDNEYIFMLNFNDKVIPNSYKDTEYITDNIKKYVYLTDTRDLNIKLRKNIIKNIKNIKNLTITYKLRDSKGTYYPSTLCSAFEVIKNIKNTNISYSENYDKIKLAKSYDYYIKYGVKDKNFDILNNNYKINYNSFDNKYTNIDRVLDKLTLSYSKMNIYNKCAFRYYLTDILNLDIFEENFSTVIGNLIHKVMENVIRNNDYDYNKYILEFVKDKAFNAKEEFFLNKYIGFIGDLINEIKKEKDYMSLDNALLEKEVIIDYGNNIIFKGFIDKILYKEDNNKTYIALIDYKTGSDDISLKYLKYGINLQLPIYMYLSKYLGFNNIKYTGFYLQKINITDNDYRLLGFSNSDPDTLNYIDNNYNCSSIIKGLKTNKDGSFSRYAKILSDDEIEDIINKTENIIKDCIDNIKNNKFDINPKLDGDKNIGCLYCKFKDICFVKNKDYVSMNLTEEKEEK